MIEGFLAKYNYWIYVILMMIGFYGMVFRRNLFQKLIGMGILQTAVILFFVSTAAKRGGTLPIIDNAFPTLAANYINPLPHTLMLTAIVVMVSTTGVALALLIRIYRRYKSLEEDEIAPPEEKE